MPATRVVLIAVAGVIAGAVVGCSFALDFDGRTADAPATTGTSGVDGGSSGTSGTSGGETDGGATSSGGEAEAGTDGGTDSGTTTTECPGTAGPKPIRVGAYCIDSTEVTNAHYAAFLADAAKKVDPPKGCGGQSLQPDAFPGPNALPVVNIDWCGAHAFCKWAGKRLCGKIGGGSATSATTDSQWFDACSAKGTKTYPYGNTFDEDACVFDEDSVEAVGSKETCVGGSPGLFDMSGNVAEWEDACSGDSEAAPCRVRGGEAEDDKASNLTCAFDKKEPRNKRDSNIGFRCCSP